MLSFNSVGKVKTKRPRQSNSDAYFFQIPSIYLMMVVDLLINLGNKCSWGCQSRHFCCAGWKKRRKYCSESQQQNTAMITIVHLTLTGNRNAQPERKFTADSNDVACKRYEVTELHASQLKLVKVTTTNGCVSLMDRGVYTCVRFPMDQG